MKNFLKIDISLYTSKSIKLCDGYKECYRFKMTDSTLDYNIYYSVVLLDNDISDKRLIFLILLNENNDIIIFSKYEFYEDFYKELSRSIFNEVLDYNIIIRQIT